jgi:hypothetical protein
MRQLRHPGALCASDLKSCYDRVVYAIASLSMRRVGMPSEPIICMFTIIQDLEHHVRTICGDSKKSFGGNLWLVPCQGLDQGNGAGPQIWAVVSPPVLNYLRNEGYGVAFKTSISGDLIRFVGYAFVDDTDICQTGQDEFTTGEEVAIQMQGAMDAWEGGMRATGGTIVPEKALGT